MRLIDADELEKELEKMTQDFLDDKTIQGDFCAGVTVEMLEEVRKAPTIDAVPVVHGHWKERRKYEVGAAVDDDGWLELEELCSVCGKWVKTQWRSPLYCPKCGAKMDEVSDNGT